LAVEFAERDVAPAVLLVRLNWRKAFNRMYVRMSTKQSNPNILFA